MKRIILIISLFILGCSVVSAQNKTPKDSLMLSPRDSLLFDYLDDLYFAQPIARVYELYPTQNTWIFLKLDTIEGLISMVQFSLDSGNRFEIPLDSTSKLSESAPTICGRFKLVPTQNMFNFLLLDQMDGRVWQVQWGFEAKDRIVTRIY